MNKYRNQILTTAVTCIVALSSTHTLHGQYYVVTDLGMIAPPLSNAKNINDHGDVVGVSTVATGDFHGSVWQRGAIDIGTLGVDTQSIAYAINDNGEATGVSYNYGDIKPHAFFWSAGTTTSLGDFSPHDINNSGKIVGYRTYFGMDRLWNEHACAWEAGNITDLLGLGGRNSQAFAVSQNGDAVGQAFLADNMTVRACLWFAGAAHDLGTLAGTATAKSAAMDINGNRQIVGWSDTLGGSSHACLFEVDVAGNVLARTDIGAFANSASIAFGINDEGDFVGASDYRGFIWRDGTLSDLNDLIPDNAEWTITRAVAINNAGEIAADAMRFGFTHAVKLTPVGCLKGDMNRDGALNGLDVQVFVDVIQNGGDGWQTCAGDVHLAYDGAVTIDDIDTFVQCLLGGGC